RFSPPIGKPAWAWKRQPRSRCGNPSRRLLRRRSGHSRSTMMTRSGRRSFETYGRAAWSFQRPEGWWKQRQRLIRRKMFARLQKNSLRLIKHSFNECPVCKEDGVAMKTQISTGVLAFGLMCLVCFGLLEPESAHAQSVSIAILDFQDDSNATAQSDLGQKLARDLRQRVATAYKDVLPRLVSSLSATGLTLEQIAALGKQSGATYVVRGELL